MRRVVVLLLSHVLALSGGYLAGQQSELRASLKQHESEAAVALAERVFLLADLRMGAVDDGVAIVEAEMERLAASLAGSGRESSLSPSAARALVYFKLYREAFPSEANSLEGVLASLPDLSTTSASSVRPEVKWLVEQRNARRAGVQP
jgi:hypothetical protein